ncbi:GMC family oxidoreductase [Halopseudomonas xiamenensis]|uniref:GMC family oxidoreductase n=1 Tax=Halopseudomonas xiamenensis TaxID=157792 RepID=UPI0016271CE4|nr:GMC family oxidoreductase [Halopseudomonas xiamenensis]
MSIKDPFAEGLARGWKAHNASLLTEDLTLEADIAIVGSGAGGATSAEILSAAGYKVLLIEEGGLFTSTDFKMQESDAYPTLYQESAGRASKDGAVLILQGRAVGGTTLVNWTSSFRTPEHTLQHWASEHAVIGHSREQMAPWFARMEQRLGIARWGLPPNDNNDVLRKGCEQLGLHWAVIPRNVRGCWNLGYCGLGCPTNAKQSMLVTCIPSLLEQGGELLYLARAQRLLLEGDRVSGIECLAMDERCVAPTGHRIRVRARHYILAGGGINTPAILMRSDAPDPHKRAGKRTYLHPTTSAWGQFEQTINPFYGAPQSIYSDHFLWPDDSATGRMGYKLEVPPLQPGFTASMLGDFGQPHAALMKQLPNSNMMIALLRDGFHPDSAEGTVQLRDDGSPVLDYQLTDYTWEAVRRSHLTMLELQFAAGARAAAPLHNDAELVTSMQAARRMIDGLDQRRYKTRLGSAHVMGGCAMGEDPSQAVTDSLGRHHQLENLSIHDGSLFPTSVGANPQLSIYALTAKLSSLLAERLAG